MPFAPLLSAAGTDRLLVAVFVIGIVTTDVMKTVSDAEGTAVTTVSSVTADGGAIVCSSGVVAGVNVMNVPPVVVSSSDTGAVDAGGAAGSVVAGVSTGMTGDGVVAGATAVVVSGAGTGAGTGLATAGAAFMMAVSMPWSTIMSP